MPTRRTKDKGWFGPLAEEKPYLKKTPRRRNRLNKRDPLGRVWHFEEILELVVRVAAA
jgi:hypothetical protein